MRRQIRLAWLVLALAISCHADYDRPLMAYRGAFDPAQVDSVVSVVKRIAEDRDLDVFEKDRQIMATITRGEPAFFLGLYLDEDIILSITNAGAGSIIHISVDRSPKVSEADLRSLAEELRSALANEVGVSVLPHEE